MKEEHKWRIVKVDGARNPYHVEYNPNAGKPEYVQQWVIFGHASSLEEARILLKKERGFYESVITKTVVHTE